MIRLCLTFLLSLGLVSCASDRPPRKSEREKKAELYYSHGTQKLVRQKYTSALDNLLKALRYDSDNPKVHNNLGMAFYFKGDKKKAVHHIRRSLEIDPKNSDARNNLASLYFESRRLDQALSQYQKILKDLVYPHQYRSHYNIALIYQRQEKKQKALKHLRLALKENNDYCPAYYELGMLLKRQDKLKEAQKAFEDGTKGACYEEPAPLYQLGSIYYLRGKKQKAEEKFEDLRKRFPQSPYFELASQQLKNINNGFNPEVMSFIDQSWQSSSPSSKPESKVHFESPDY